MQQRLRILRPATLRDELDAAARALPAPTMAAADLDVIEAHLACGDFAAVLGLIRGAAPDPVLPLVLARYVRWSGDLKTAAAAWDTVVRVLDDQLTGDSRTAGDGHRDDVPGSFRALEHATATALAPLATDLGHVQLAARLHGVARQAEERDLNLHRHPAATVVRRIASEVIGIEPDAVRGRLQLRPRLDRLNELVVQEIRFGDASIRLNASARESRVEVRVEQDAGAIPVTVLLEPYVTPLLAASFRAAVDGHAADLVPRVSGDGTVFPVQLVLDEERTLVVER